MKNINLFTKVITPILIIGVVLSYIGFIYINTFIQTTINNEIDQKIKTKIHLVEKEIKSEFKLLFYLYGTSSGSYNMQETLAKKSIINNLINTNKNNHKDILYIIDENEYLQISKKDLTSMELARIVRKNPDLMEINNNDYKLFQLYFKPWNWRIIYLLDISDFNNVIHKNKIGILSTSYATLFIIILLIIIIFKLEIKRPLDLILKYLSYIQKGDYKTIDKVYNTKEIDILIDNINSMSSTIKQREKESIKLLDITKKNEEYMQDILSSQNSIIIINNSKEILDVNDSFYRYFDEFKTLDEFKEKHSCVCDYFIKEEGYIYKQENVNWVEDLVNNQDKLHKVKMLKNKQYYYFTISAINSPRINRIIITMTDITQLEKSNNLVNEYKKAVDASAIVSKTDKKGKITYVNDKFIDISGYTLSELKGKTHNIVKSENTNSEIFDDMWTTISSKNIWNGMIENKKKNGDSYFVNATIVPMIDENNNIVEYIALRYDITEQIEAIKKAKKAEQTKSLFLANMSHEIRTPLNAIIGFTSILKRSKLEKKESNYIDIIDTSAGNLLGIVNDILDISKMENGNLVCEKIEFNPFREFNAVIDLFIAKADEKNINLIPYIDPRIMQKLIGDPLRIKQVISNLISNAIKFSKENTNINVHISLSSQEEKSCKIRFSIKDNGIGISKDKQKTIFEEFTQADDSTSREYGGTGLGLSISNKIVNALGSNIELKSEENKGAEFYFELEYDVVELDNKNLEELNDLNIYIIKPKNEKEYNFKLLHTYLNTITKVTIVNDTSEIKNIDNSYLIIVDENNIDNNIINSKNKIIVLSKDKIEFTQLKEYTIMNIPLNNSIIFDTLVENINHESILGDVDSSGYSQFTGQVLIAEDHEINQQLISMLLDLRGIEYTFANNGQEAVDLYKDNTYDLVLMDINMPVKNGKEATTEIIEFEKQNTLIHTPIVALTANVIEADKEKTMEVGFDGYLLKPIDETKLDETFTMYLKLNNSDKKEFDFEVCANEIGLPVNTIKKIITKFISSIDKDLDDLKLSITNNDYKSITNIAHKIKGAALNLRINDIALYTKSIEEQGINEMNVSIDDDFTNLINIVNSIKDSIDN